MNLEEIKKKALEEHIPIILDDTLEVIKYIMAKKKPKRILEIGTAVGYSSLCFSEFLEDEGIIDTIEREHAKVLEAKENIAKFNFSKNNTINVLEGDAVEILPKLENIITGIVEKMLK